MLKQTRRSNTLVGHVPHVNMDPCSNVNSVIKVKLKNSCLQTSRNSPQSFSKRDVSPRIPVTSCATCHGITFVVFTNTNDPVD